MKRREFRKTWIVVDHPQQLAIAIYVSRSIKQILGYKSNLVISKHAYWKKLNVDKYRKEFAKIREFERLDYPPPTLSNLYQFALSGLLFFKLFALKAFVLNLKIQKNDLIIGLSTQQFLENMMISSYSETPNIEIVPSYVYKNYTKGLNSRKYHYSLGSLLVKYIQKLFGMNEVFCKYKKGVGNRNDGYPLQRYKKPLTEVYDKVMIMENRSDDIGVHRISNVIFTRYPLDFDLFRQGKRSKKKVVFLGEDYLNLNNILDRKGIERRKVFINKCLGYIRKNFGLKYDLYYKPHPNETTELSQLDARGFVVYKGAESAELFFIENRPNINSVFSVISTASRSALSAGIPSYVFYKMSPDRKIFSKEWDELLGKIPDSVLIKSFKNKPKNIVFDKQTRGSSIFRRQLSSCIKNIHNCQIPNN